MFLIALVAGVICAVVVAAYFIAVDQRRAALAANGLWSPPAQKQTVVKQLESLFRPFGARLPARTAGQLRQKLSRAGDPGGFPGAFGT